MNRYFLGIGLLGLLLVTGLLSGFLMEDHHAPIADRLEQAAELALSGDLQGSAARVQQAKEKWDRRWQVVASLSDHAPMDEIDGLFSQAELYCAAGRTGDFAACCARLSQLIRANGEAHALNWWNLL